MTLSGNFSLASDERRVDPDGQRGAGGGEEALPLFRLELVGERDGREAGGVEDFVGVGVAHAADEARIGEGALEGAIFEGEGGAEGVESRFRRKDFDAAGIDVAEGLLAAEEMERGAAFGAGFSEDERAGRKVKARAAPGGRRVWLAADASGGGRQS